MSESIDQRLAKQRKFYRYQYARRLACSDNPLVMADFKLRTGQYGEAWKIEIWKLRNEIKRGER